MNLFDLFVKLGLDDSEFESGLQKAEKAVSAAGVAVSAAVGAAFAGASALVKQSVDAYKNYEQLVGGVETLFSNLEGTLSAAPAVIENANNAFKTANMSANEYMETVTSFSAALIASLENDYDKAAEVSDMAIQDMADNANKMGSSLESLRSAYAGFAKSNFTLLDNLKLGYGGTKEEMERLLKDASRISGIKYDISSLSDMYEAIHVIQKEMGIAGATAEEAATTIEGSLNMLGGAWENLVAGFANKNADLGKLIDDVVTSAETALDNLLPAVETSIGGIISAVDTVAPMIIDRLPDLTGKILPPMISAARSIVETLVSVLPGMLSSVVDMIPDIAKDIIETAADMAPKLVDLGVGLINSLASGMKDTLPELTPIAVDAVLKFAESLIDNADDVADAAFQIITALADGLTNEKTVTLLVEKAPVLIVKLTTALIMATPKLIEASTKIIKTIADNLVHVDWRETADKMMTNLISALDQSIKQVAVWIDNATSFLTGQESKYGGDIANVPTSAFITWMEAGKDDVVNAVGDVTETIAEGYDAFYGTIEDGNEKASEAIDRSTAYYNIPTVMSDYAESLEKQAKGWNKKVTNTVAQTEEDIKEIEARLKAKFRELETTMIQMGYDDEWLVKQERAYIEALDHGSDLYKDYNLKLLKAEKQINDQAKKEREAELTKQQKEHENAVKKQADLFKKQVENYKKSISSVVQSAKDKIKEYQKVIDDVKSQISSFADNLTQTYSDMFSFDVDEKTGKITATKTKDYLYDATKQLEQYYANIQKLRERGASETMLNQLTTMDADKGAAVAKYWASLNDKQLAALDENWKRYEEASNKVSETLYSDELAEAEKELDEQRNTLLGEIRDQISTGMLDLSRSLMSVATTAAGGNGNVTVNIAGQKIIETTMQNMLNAIKNSGGVLDV